MFDLHTKLAMYLDPDTDTFSLRNDRSNWVPLDVILRHWLQLFELGKFYVEGTEIKEHEYAPLELDRDLQAWEGYLQVLEAKTEEHRSATTILRVDTNDVVSEERDRQLDAKLIQAAIEQNKLDPIGPVLLSRLRRPNHDVKHIGPRLVCFVDVLFSKMYSVTSSTTAEAPNEFPLLYPELEQKSNLLFPAIGPSSTLELGDARMIWPWNGMGKFPGVWAYADRGSQYTVLDHKGGQDIFHNQDTVPWGRPSSPLADMFRAWKAMLVNGYWQVNHDSVVSDYFWFAENRKISWREATIWGEIEHADGDILEMSNDWIEDLMEQNEGLRAKEIYTASTN